MKIAYVIDSLAGGGAERSLVEMAPHIVSNGVELTIVLLHDRGELREEARDAGAKLVVVDGGSRSSWAANLRPLLRAEHPDVVHTTLFDADVVGRLAARSVGIPVTGSLVNVQYGPESVQPGVLPWKQRAVWAVDAATSRLATRLHAVSEWVAEVMGKRLHYPRERITVVPRGRDPRHLGRRTPERRAAARARLGMLDSQRLVLAVGRQESQKGFDRLLRAMPEMRANQPDAIVRVAGRAGRETDRLRVVAREVGVDPDEVFLGSRTDVPDLLCAADVFVLTSRTEGMPGALIEAMALEVPIVVSEVPVAVEVAGPHTRVVHDGESWSAAIAEALTHPDPVSERRRMFEDRHTSAAAGRRMTEFWWDVVDTSGGRQRGRQRR